MGIWQLFGGLAFWSFLGVIRDSQEGLLGVQIYRIPGFLSIQMCFWGSNSANFADRERPDPFIYRVWGLCANRFSGTRRSTAGPYSLTFRSAFYESTEKLGIWAPRLERYDSRAKRGIWKWCLSTAPPQLPKELEKHFLQKFVTQWGWWEACFSEQNMCCFL